MSNFADIYGHDKIKEHLQSAIALDKISHAYILDGGLGSGKKMLAQIFAKTLQCENCQKTLESGLIDIADLDLNLINPCNECHSCCQTDSNNQPDIIWIKHEKPASIGVDDIRDQLIGDIQIRPYSSKYKIYIIDEAEKMTIQAQNALLKTIEEPPVYGIVILLTTNADIFLQTILSRCVVLDLKPVQNEIVEQYLKDKYQTSVHECHFAAAFAQGKIGRAVSIVESPEFGKLKEDVLRVVKHATEMSTSEIMAEVKNITNYKLTINDYLDLMAMWYRDVLMFKSTNNANLVIFKDELLDMKSQADVVSYEGLDDIISSIDKVKLRLRANVNFDLVIELLIMAIKENM